jgi:hypothetical protein
MESVDQGEYFEFHRPLVIVILVKSTLIWAQVRTAVVGKMDVYRILVTELPSLSVHFYSASETPFLVFILFKIRVQILRVDAPIGHNVLLGISRRESSSTVVSVGA